MGAKHAGAVYWILGSLQTNPGFSVAGVHIPLNPDAWFQFTLALPNTPPLFQTLGLLDPRGKQGAAIFLPKGSPPYLLGLSLYHAAIVFQNGIPVLASNPVRLKIER